MLTGRRRRHARVGWGVAASLLLTVSACKRPGSDEIAVGSVPGATDPALSALPPPASAPSESAQGVPATSVAPNSAAPTLAPGSADPTTIDIDDITVDFVPRDVIVPSDERSLNGSSNPINGARGGARPTEAAVACASAADVACLVPTLDLLGFDVTSGPPEEHERQARRAIAVLQLDAGMEKTGVPDEALLEYLGIRLPEDSPYAPDEVRVIGASADDRPITAMRYGDGDRTVLVVGQTHGDEEAGLRVLLRARLEPLPEDVTLWVIPTMNPDGGLADSRFQANGANLNRAAVSEPEQEAVYDFALEIEPELSVWYHQNYGWVGASGSSVVPAQQYQALTGLGTLRRSGDCAKGFMWCPIDEALGASSILVELPDVVTPADVKIHAAALMEVISSEV